MTEREALRARRAILLPLYSDPESDVQAVEVAHELRQIAERLKELPYEPVKPKEPPKRGRRRWGNRGMDRSAGRS